MSLETLEVVQPVLIRVGFGATVVRNPLRLVLDTGAE